MGVCEQIQTPNKTLVKMSNVNLKKRKINFSIKCPSLFWILVKSGSALAHR